jgi:hypothetical protein
MGTTLANPAPGPGAFLETSQTFTPLGLRFWDLTQDLPVTDGLAVSLRLAGSGAPALSAVLTRSGVYGFFGLPGLYAAEHPSANNNPPAQTFSYVVTVQDLLSRYLPAVLVFTLDQTGAILVQGVAQRASDPRLVYLFSAVSRPVPPGVGAIYADLLDRDTNRPATWAVVQAQIAGETEVWTGIADDSGRAVVLAPYPVIQRLVLGSPPGSGQGNITGQSWSITITAQYSPDQLAYPAAAFPNAQWPWTDTPSLKDILTAQAAATLWTDAATPQLQLTETLVLGQNLVLSSSAGSPPSPTWTLSISRGSSPP